MRRAELNAIQAQAGVHGLDWRLLVAIRATENGVGDEFKGTPYGMIYSSHKAEDWQGNLEACCEWLADHIMRLMAANVVRTAFASSKPAGHRVLGYSDELIEKLGWRFSPPATNPHWLPNMLKFYARLMAEGADWLVS